MGGRLTAREKRFDASEWTALVGSSPGFGLVQTFEYGQAKTETGPWLMRHLLIEEAGRPVAAAQVMLRDLPVVRGGLAWINRGPILLSGAGDSPAAMTGALDALVRYWAKERNYYLRVAPPWANGPALDTGMRPAGRPGWASARLDLSSPLETLRAGLRKNWRSALISAEKDGVESRAGERIRALSRGISELSDGTGLRDSCHAGFFGRAAAAPTRDAQASGLHRRS